LVVQVGFIGGPAADAPFPRAELAAFEALFGGKENAGDGFDRRHQEVV